MEEPTVTMSVEDVESKSPQSKPSSKVEKKNKTNTLGKSLKMKLEIMVPPDEDQQQEEVVAP